MAWNRHITDVLCSAGLSVVVAVLLLGQCGIGGPVASLTKQRCGAPCPCDDDRPDANAASEAPDGDQHGDCDHEPVAERIDGAGSENETPCNDDTPCDDNCPDCTCAAGHVASLPALAALGITRALSTTRAFVALDVPAGGNASGVFRPPRSLS